MALLSFSPAASKGSSSTVTLNKTELLALPEVSGNPFWSATSGSNISKVIILYKTSEGEQKKLLKFDFSQSSPTANVVFSLKARNTFQISSIALNDFDAGELVINRAEFLITTPSLINLDLDISGSEPPSGVLPVTDWIGHWDASSLALSPGDVVTSWPSLTNSTKVGFTPPASSIVGTPKLYVDPISNKNLVHFKKDTFDAFTDYTGDGQLNTGCNIGTNTYTIFACYDGAIAPDPSFTQSRVIVGNTGMPYDWFIGEYGGPDKHAWFITNTFPYNNIDKHDFVVIAARGTIVPGYGSVNDGYFMGNRVGVDVINHPLPYPGYISARSGCLTELIVFDRDLTVQEIQDVSNYLITKYRC